MMQLKRAALLLTLAASLTASVMAAPNWKTLTDAPRNVDGVGLDKASPRMVTHSGGDVVLAVGNDHWVTNKAGQMGADKEFFNEKLGARWGVWAGDSIAGKKPRDLVTEWSNNIKTITGGTWTAPKATTIAGIPVVQAYGVDVHGNYAYRIVSFTKFGVNYASALRCDYEDRNSRQIDADLTRFVTESHLSTMAFHKTGKYK